MSFKKTLSGPKVKSGAAALVLIALIGTPFRPGVTKLPISVPGAEPQGGKASICIGFSEAEQRYGAQWGMCPANHALYGVDDPAGVEGPAEKINAVMSCCPLPSNDILLDEHAFTTDSCPDGYVATGRKSEGEGDAQKHFMRCSKVNSNRYQLSSATPAVYWGGGAAGWKKSTRIAWENIPAGMRYAHGRKDKSNWDVDGCVGFPWGSMLTAKQTKHCSGMSFRQLQFKGVGEDPAPGTPVKMFADCDEISNVEDPKNASCVKRG